MVSRGRAIASRLLSLLLAGAAVLPVGGAIGCAPSPATAPAPTAPGTPAGPAPTAPAAEARVQLLAFNDFHGALEPPGGSAGRVEVRDPQRPGARVEVEAGGVEFLATHLRALAADEPHTLIVSAGDVVGASPFLSGAFHDEPTVEALSALGLAVSAVGNHELDEGVGELWRLQAGGCHPREGCFDADGFAGAGWQYLAANVLEAASGATVLPGWTERTFGDVRVAFVGVAPAETPTVAPLPGDPRLDFRDEAESVNALVPEIRARGIEAIVVLLHEGGYADGLPDECVRPSGPIVDLVPRLDRAVDVVVTGHTHDAYVCELDGRLVTSAGASGRLVTAIDLRLDPRTGDVTARAARNVPVTRTVEKDPAQTALLAKWRALAGPVAGRVVGTLAPGVDLSRAPDAAGESPLGDIIADAQLAATAGAGEGGAQLALMNPGGIRTGLEYGLSWSGEAPGELTYAEVFAVQPFANTLVTLTLTGAQIRAVLRQQWCRDGADRGEKRTILQVSEGFSYAWDDRRPACGDRLDEASVRLNGQPLDPAASYRVTVNSFLAGGGDGLPTLAEGTDRVVAPGGDVDALVAWLQAHPGLTPPKGGRIRLVQRP